MTRTEEKQNAVSMSINSIHIKAKEIEEILIQSRKLVNELTEEEFNEAFKDDEDLKNKYNDITKILKNVIF